MSELQPNNITTIPIPSGTEYLNQVLTSLPNNCIFDKGKVGGGGTTIALESDDNYIIAVPFISLIQNKVNKYGDSVFGVYGSLLSSQKIREIRNYHNNHNPKKYLVTYDSLEKLINILGDISDFKLLVDEYHLLFTQYAFRESAAETVLRCYRRFNEFCFMSGTPLTEDFILDELRGLPIVKAIWEEREEKTVNSVRCKDVLSAVRLEVRKYLNNEISGNAYFFINSTEFIRLLIDEEDLTSENTRIICGNNKRNNVIAGINNSTTYSAPKKINLLTSTAYEGSDILDEEGRIYIVSNGDKSHMLTDISTSFLQIANRIRNTEHNDKITHYYSHTKFSDSISYDEYKELYDSNSERAQGIIEELNQLSEEAKNVIASINSGEYITRRGNEFIFNINLYNLNLYEYKLSRSLYANRELLNAEYQLFGLNVSPQHNNTELPLSADNGGTTFKNAVLFINSTGLFPGYSENGMRLKSKILSPSEEDDDEELIQCRSYFARWPFLEDAIKLLGYERIEYLKYRPTNIKRHTELARHKSESATIASLLEIENISGKWFSKPEIKIIIQKVYDFLGLYVTANANHIEDYFECREKERRGVVGYSIGTKRSFFNR